MILPKSTALMLAPNKLTSIRKPYAAPYFLDSATYFLSELDDPVIPDAVKLIGFHNVARTWHLPPDPRATVASSRHGRGRLNALFFDGHVDGVKATDLTLDFFDDGIRTMNHRMPEQPR